MAALQERMRAEDEDLDQVSNIVGDLRNMAVRCHADGGPCCAPDRCFACQIACTWVALDTHPHTHAHTRTHTHARTQLDMGREIDRQNSLLDDLATDVDDANERLKDQNKEMIRILK